MNKSTHKQFYPASNNDERVKNLMEMIDEKDADIKNWEKKYNQLYISKFSLIQTKQRLSLLIIQMLVKHYKPNLNNLLKNDNKIGKGMQMPKIN